MPAYCRRCCFAFCARTSLVIGLSWPLLLGALEGRTGKLTRLPLQSDCCAHRGNSDLLEEAERASARPSRVRRSTSRAGGDVDRADDDSQSTIVFPGHPAARGGKA